MRDRKDMDTYIEKNKIIGMIKATPLVEGHEDACRMTLKMACEVLEGELDTALTQTAEKARVEERELMKLEYNRIFGWLLGNYGDFPDLSKKPHYSFRTELREKLEALKASPTKN